MKTSNILCLFLVSISLSFPLLSDAAVFPKCLENVRSFFRSSQSKQEKFVAYVNTKRLGHNELGPLTKQQAQRLIRHSDKLKIYAHTYSYTLNLKYSDFNIMDLIKLSKENGLSGVNTHINHILSFGKDPESWRSIARIAKERRQELILEISNTSKFEIDRALQVAEVMGINNIRIYPRKEGYVSDILAAVRSDLEYAISHSIAEKRKITFHLEQHEDLKSHELVRMLKKINSPRLKLLFDFTNMIPAFENPIEALAKQAPHVEFVHLNDAKILKQNNGFGFMGTKTDSGDIPIRRLIFDLLQYENVRVISLEEQVGYPAPAFRFRGEAGDVFIPARGASKTPVDKKSLNKLMRNELRDSSEQIKTIQQIIAQLREFAFSLL